MQEQYNPACKGVNKFHCLNNQTYVGTIARMTLGERLIQARMYAGLKVQKDLADKSGVSQQTISNIESGKQISSSEVVKLAVACGVDPVWLDMGVGAMVSSYLVSNPRIEHALKIMEQLPPEALDYVIRDLDQTAELVNKLSRDTNSAGKGTA